MGAWHPVQQITGGSVGSFRSSVSAHAEKNVLLGMPKIDLCRSEVPIITGVPTTSAFGGREE